MAAVPQATLRTTVIFLCLVSAVAETFTRSYITFNLTKADLGNIELQPENYATVHNDALQITPDTSSPGVFNLQNQSGRIMLLQSFNLWDDNSVASFDTYFLVNIYPNPNRNSTPGEGLAFVISPTLGIPDNSYGQYLGLTNPDTDNQTTNGIVAVELDTVKQSFDPDNNHIGLNIHSIDSVISKPLTPLNITLAPPQVVFHNVWIEYSGREKFIRVYIASQTDMRSPAPPRPNTPIIEYPLNLQETVQKYSYFGFAASTGTLVELNSVLRWELSVQQITGSNSNSNTTSGSDSNSNTTSGSESNSNSKGPLFMKLLLSVGIPLVVVLLGLGAYFGYYWYKRRLVDRSNSYILNRLRTLPGMPKEFRFKELKKATNNFDEKRKLGQGGFGVVYHGLLSEDNGEVAVKWFSRESSKGEYDFLAELTIINRLRHKHLVRLLGWCHKNGKLLLVYEYMQKGSLDMHLFTRTGDILSWTLRCQILAGVASAINYLHYEYDQKVVHRDIKASNIMLDSHFNARLGDFGLARALDNEKTSYAEAEGMLGTIGYIAPECFLTGKATQYSDIYAFGALVIEVVSGKRPGTKINGFELMVDYVWSLYREGRILDVVDERIQDDYYKEEAQRLLLLGLACSHPIAIERPQTHAIVQILSGSYAAPPVPPFKPSFVWPAMMPIDDNSQATSVDTTPVSISQF